LHYPHLSHTEIFESLETFYKAGFRRKKSRPGRRDDRSPDMMRRGLREGVEFFQFLRHREMAADTPGVGCASFETHFSGPPQMRKLHFLSKTWSSEEPEGRLEGRNRRFRPECGADVGPMISAATSRSTRRSRRLRDGILLRELMVGPRGRCGEPRPPAPGLRVGTSC
jgi:hypothetical protein